MGDTLVKLDSLGKAELCSVLKPWSPFPGIGSLVKHLTKCRSDLTSSVCWRHCVVNLRSAIMVAWAANRASPVGSWPSSRVASPELFHCTSDFLLNISSPSVPVLHIHSLCSLFSRLCLLRHSKLTGIGT